MKLVETQFSARLRLGDVGDVIGELEAAVADVPVPGRSVGAADHRAVPSRAPGRRARDVPAGPDTSWPTSSASTPDRSCSSSSNGSWSTTRHSASRSHGGALDPTPAGNLPSMSVELVGREPEIGSAVATCSPSERLVEIVGPGGIGKTAVAIATGQHADRVGRRCRGARWRLVGPARDPRRPPMRSSTR